MDYEFILNFNELPKWLIDKKFDDWKKYMEENKPRMSDIESDAYVPEFDLRNKFEESVEPHFPVCF